MSYRKAVWVECDGLRCTASLGPCSMYDAKAEIDRFGWLRLKQGRHSAHYCPSCKLKPVEVKVYREKRPKKRVVLPPGSGMLPIGPRQ